MKALKILSLFFAVALTAVACTTTPENTLPAPAPNEVVKNDLTGGSEQLWEIVFTQTTIIEVTDNGQQLQLNAAQTANLENKLQSDFLPPGGFLFNTNGGFKGLGATQDINNPILEGTFLVKNNGQILEVTVPPSPPLNVEVISIDGVDLLLRFTVDVDFEGNDVIVTFEQAFTKAV